MRHQSNYWDNEQGTGMLKTMSFIEHKLLELWKMHNYHLILAPLW